MNVLRTPDERFADLPGFAYAPHYAEIDGMRMHYVDEGSARGQGHRAVPARRAELGLPVSQDDPVFTQAGLRVVAPDWFGFGRSDKPQDDAWYSFDLHRDSMLQFD